MSSTRSKVRLMLFGQLPDLVEQERPAVGRADQPLALGHARHGETINVGSGRGVTIEELVHTMLRVAGTPPKDARLGAERQGRLEAAE